MSRPIKHFPKTILLICRTDFLNGLVKAVLMTGAELDSLFLRLVYQGTGIIHGKGQRLFHNHVATGIHASHRNGKVLAAVGGNRYQLRFFHPEHLMIVLIETGRLPVSNKPLLLFHALLKQIAHCNKCQIVCVMNSCRYMVRRNPSASDQTIAYFFQSKFPLLF